MLEYLFSAPEKGAQCIKTIVCVDCGAAVPKTSVTGRQLYCLDCGAARRRERDRQAAAKRRRAEGIPKVRGETFACEECGCGYVATSKSRQKWCADCKPRMDAERARRKSYENDKDGSRKRIGRTELCVHCGEAFTVDSKGGKRCYCSECQILNKQGKLPHLREASREWRRNRYRDDPKFALNEFMRGGILKSLGDKKDGNSWTTFVDYTVDELKVHLERQFLHGMSWKNRGISGWHIDHILPISSFRYDSPEHPDFKACWALTNLRPMWGSDNIRKKDKRLFLI